MFSHTLIFFLVFSASALLSSALPEESSSPPVVGENKPVVQNLKSYYAPYGIYYPQFGQYPGYIPIGYPYVTPAATVAATTTTLVPTTTGRPLQPGVTTAYPLGAGVGFQRPGFYYPYPGQFQQPAAGQGLQGFYGRK